MKRPQVPPAAITAASVHLDALRGAAALLVFVNHTRALFFASPIPHSDPVRQVAVVGQDTTAGASPAGTFDSYGFGAIHIANAAVIVFFVLSGYLVGGSVIRGLRLRRWSWSTYLQRRLVRLLVVLVPALLLGAVLDRVGSHLSGPGSVYQAPAGMSLTVAADLAQRSTPMVLLGNLAFLQNITVPVFGTNASLWSLSYEFWYYLIFPLAACAIASMYRPIPRILSALGAVLLLYFIGGRAALLFPVWLCGALVSIIPTEAAKPLGKVLAPLGACVLIASIVLLRILNVNTLPASYVIALTSSLLLYGIVLQNRAWMTTSALAGAYRAVTKLFSETSYSLYLFHLPLAVFLCGLLDSPWHPWRRTFSSALSFLLLDMLVLGCIYVLWRLFEAKTDVLRSKIDLVTRAKMTTGR